ncbi:MAG: hypothetical protein PHE55_12055 [Methylococcaceae bacterium]|nr:hypothetical protein [Methylococcaceae bacterium]
MTADALREIQCLLEGEAPSAECVASVRKAFPGLSLTRCDASDMDTETPVLETARFNVYLIDTAEHCARISTDPAKASGLILAEKR